MKRGILLLFAAALAAGCASSGPPVAPAVIAETEAAVRRAESAGAAERAPDLMTKARRAWDDGRLASSQGNHEFANRRLAEAREYAEAAEAKAVAEKLRSEAAALKQQADELEARGRQIRGEARP